MFEFFRKIERNRFARLVLAEIAKRGGPTDYVYDPNAFTITRADSVGHLSPSFAVYKQANATHRRLVLANFAATFASVTAAEQPSLEEARPKLVTVMRERLLVESGVAWSLDRLADKRPKSVCEPVSAWFAKALVLDFPTHMSWVTEDNLRERNLSSFEAFELGLTNLRERTVAQFSQEGRIFVGTWKDDYDSSRALLPDLFNDLPLDGDPVVCLPERLTLLVAGSNDSDGVRELLAKAEQIVRNAPKPQNPSPLILQGGMVSDFLVPESSPLFHAVQGAHRVAALVSYQEQKEQLDRLYEQNKKEVFVASYTLAKHPEGKFESHSVWSKDVPTLLPVTDMVAFFNGDLPESEKLIGQASFEKVSAVLGDLMLDTKMFPKRFYVSRFPTADQLRSLIG